MSLGAFTNEPGDHYLYDWAIGFQDGKYYGSENLHEEIYADSYPCEFASKWYPTPGFGLNTDWSRTVRKVLQNEPAKWRRFIKEGNPPDDYVTVDLTGDEHVTEHYRPFSYVVPNPGMDNAKSESVTKCLNNLTAHYVGVGADLAEARQTCDMMSGAALRAGLFLKAIKERNLKQLKSALGKSFRSLKDAEKSAANLWLEYSYGWKPLASDLYELQGPAWEALKKPVPLHAVGKGFSSFEETYNDSTYIGIGKSRASFKTELKAHITNPFLANLSSSGLLNPWSVAWEVVPFSFAIDWFMPIGATLQAITAGVGLEMDGGWTSMHVNDEMNFGLTPNFTGYGYGRVSPGDYRDVGFAFHRQCYASFPAPELYVDVTPYSTPRALNALAITRQLA